MSHVKAIGSTKVSDQAALATINQTAHAGANFYQSSCSKHSHRRHDYTSRAARHRRHQRRIQNRLYSWESGASTALHDRSSVQHLQQCTGRILIHHLGVEGRMLASLIGENGIVKFNIIFFQKLHWNLRRDIPLAERE